jgi:hypothetical protein
VQTFEAINKDAADGFLCNCRSWHTNLTTSHTLVEIARHVGRALAPAKSGGPAKIPSPQKLQHRHPRYHPWPLDRHTPLFDNLNMWTGCADMNLSEANTEWAGKFRFTMYAVKRDNAVPFNATQSAGSATQGHEQQTVH